jgi:hypothetical protein
LRPDRPSRLWLVDGRAADAWPVVWVAASAVGDAALRVPGADLRGMHPNKRRIVQDAGEVPTALVGGSGDDIGWQLDVVRSDHEIPGGGLLLFPDRRLVAFYGNPSTPGLGVLGEQGPEATIDRMTPIAAEYGADGIPVVPAFEIIATVASTSAGADGDYSEEASVDEIRPWVDLARERGVYVILDLQPGRTDFLTQAKRYRELLREPHVGLALDPEWRLEPDQVHLAQIGSVDSAEVNRVARWMARMVRREALPQKLLLLHQFRLDMIRGREEIEIPPELAVAIQSDGQGTLGSKYGTWSVLTAGTADSGWWWGWKNFYDEDSPMATPSQVLDLVPTVHYVSFQ